MISINKFYIFLIITTISAENYTVTDSYNYLINRSSNSHPTTHIINLLRSGSEGLNSQEILRLRSFGSVVKKVASKYFFFSSKAIP